ncbi:MAG: hydantoinase B/oxoprolinase family protein [Candidatus Obscuribacterales bacterium]|jgi:5-oxoprolinase (ATP-hydrolysing)
MPFEFYIDRGGTFTDIVALAPDGRIFVHKILSELSGVTSDPAVVGIANILYQAESAQNESTQNESAQDESAQANKDRPSHSIKQVRIGTTVATNALLERKGEPLLLVTNRGMKDALKIGYQNRSDIFALEIIKTTPIFSEVIEVPGRFSDSGEEIESFDTEQTTLLLTAAKDSGIESVSIVFMHSYKYPQHERQCAAIAKELGFKNVTTSSEINPLIKFISRGDTTLVDGYLTPALHRYIDKLENEIQSLDKSRRHVSANSNTLVNDKNRANDLEIRFMKSDGGLTTKDLFRGRDALISGPAGGVVGATKSAAVHGLHNIVGFDMGGTSTDVCYFQGEFERVFETTIDGIRVRAPMLAVHTVAAGGGSILSFAGDRFLVGPQSAGAQPGPACYGHNGPLTVTDANLILGRISPAHFPHSFGSDHQQPLDSVATSSSFNILREKINGSANYKTIESIAWGFLTVAVEKMAQAISKVSTQKGHDVSEATIVAFGGAGGQHACLIAERLGVKQVLISPLAGVLSAYGIGATAMSATAELSVRQELTDRLLEELQCHIESLSQSARQKVLVQNPNEVTFECQLFLRYQDSDTTIAIPLNSNHKAIIAEFHSRHKKLFGFGFESNRPTLEEIRVTAHSPAPNLSITAIEQVSAGDAIVSSPSASPAPCASSSHPASPSSSASALPSPKGEHRLFAQGHWHTTEVLMRDKLEVGTTIEGPALIAEYTATTVLEPGWTAEVLYDGSLLLRCDQIEIAPEENAEATVDPVKLELFSNMFMSIAEEMGITLQQVSHSVNIKERLDFSCALFDSSGRLIANAPHIPVHLGSMGDSVVSLIRSRDDDSSKRPITAGDVYVLNNPFNGGTHLPDITVISPVFDEQNQRLFFVASRGHHADIGGITPGSMPPMSTHIDEEGVLLDNLLIVADGKFDETLFVEKLQSAIYPPRNIRQNINDIKAQIAANNKGIEALQAMVQKYGRKTVTNYMEYVRANAAAAISDLLADLNDGQATSTMDDGSEVVVTIRINKSMRTAIIDFTGTSAQTKNNLNTPLAVTRAAVLYVFRTLTKANIPLNDGCMDPLELIIPSGSLLNPHEPAAVVAGNVETSQIIVDTLCRALNIMAASQGTMNNFTFGDDDKQYYETICGGSGAGFSFAGADAIQTHMTNSRLTDPEILESRFPVLVEEFSIRKNSGGTGKYKGGDGAIRRLRFLKPMSVSILSNRRSIKPPGLNGGADGQCGLNRIIRATGEVESLGSTATIDAACGDAIEIQTPGGGGYEQLES